MWRFEALKSVASNSSEGGLFDYIALFVQFELVPLLLEVDFGCLDELLGVFLPVEPHMVYLPLELQILIWEYAKGLDGVDLAELLPDSFEDGTPWGFEITDDLLICFGAGLLF